MGYLGFQYTWGLGTQRTSEVGMRRVNIRKILADPVLRKDLFVRAIRFMQAVEGIDTTEAQAARAYEKVRGEIQKNTES